MTCSAATQDLGLVYALVALMVGLIIGNATARRDPPD